MVSDHSQLMHLILSHTSILNRKCHKSVMSIVTESAPEPTIKKPATARNTAHDGPDTKCN